MRNNHDSNRSVNDQDDDLVELSERGRRWLRAPDGVSAHYLVDMTDALIANFGSAEAALIAVKCGKVVGFQKLRSNAR